MAYAFLTYFDKHGGLEIFGYPITEFKLENGRIVQYFQRARMEWHPQLPADQRVQLGNLGEIYALTRLDPSLLQPPSASIRPNVSQITALNAKASLRWAITGTTGQQTLHVYVSDQLGRPVSGAASAAVVRFASGNQTVSLPATDANGHAQKTFPLGKLDPGAVGRCPGEDDLGQRWWPRRRPRSLCGGRPSEGSRYKKNARRGIASRAL